MAFATAPCAVAPRAAAFTSPASHGRRPPVRRAVAGPPRGAAPPRARAATTRCRSDVAHVHAPITLDMADDTRMSFRFSLAAATELGTGVNDLVAAFKRIKAAAADGKRSREESLEFTHQDADLKVQVECNPNLYPDAFTAKVYVVVDDGTVKVASQAMLTRVIDNVKAYKAAMSA
jgi:methionine-rich copper-binding protein CopC